MTHEGPPKNLPDLEDTRPNFFLNKETNIHRGPTIYVSKLTPGLMIQMDYAFLNLESIRGFSSTFVDICSATSYHFGFP